VTGTAPTFTFTGIVELIDAAAICTISSPDGARRRGRGRFDSVTVIKTMGLDLTLEPLEVTQAVQHLTADIFSSPIALIGNRRTVVRAYPGSTAIPRPDDSGEVFCELDGRRAGTPLPVLRCGSARLASMSPTACGPSRRMKHLPSTSRYR